MLKRYISIMLVVSMILSMVGCGDSSSDNKMSEKLLVETILNEENLELEKNGVRLQLDPVIINTDIKASIFEVLNPPKLDVEEDINLNVYDFKLEGISNVEGVIQLTIPLKVQSDETPGAAYLNENTLTWEPVTFKYNEENSEIVIYTDHLSKYGVFSTSNLGKRRARIEFLGLYGEEKDDDFLAAIEEYSIGGVPANQCFEIGAGAAGDALQLGGDFLGNIVQSTGYLAYGDDVLSTIGDHLGNMGLLLSVVQIGNNIYNGKINDAVVGSLKTSYSYMLGKVVSKLSNSVLSASMASVAIIDYSINKFGTTAIEGRADIYRDAYSIYYFKGNDGHKGSDFWYKTFYPMFSDKYMTEENLKKEIDKIVTDHCNEFWSSSNKLGIDYYVTEAREKMAWTGGMAGLNQDLQKTISDERRAMLYNDILPGVFSQIALKINMDNENKLRSEYKALSDYLNTVISFSVKDPKKTYAKHQVRFSAINDKADVNNWTGRFKDDGTLNTSFTLYGHMYAGSPNKLEIYEPNANLEKDKPVKTIEFKVTPPSVEIVLSEDSGRLNKLITQQSSSEIISGLLVEDEYKSYYSEALFPVPLEHLLSQQVITIPKDDIIDINLNGSWEANTESGKNKLGGEWSTWYQYEIQNFNLYIKLNKNMELPVIGTEKTGLILDGTGTYSYTIKITTKSTGYQEVPALFEKAWSDSTAIRTINFNSTGNVSLYTSSKAIDDSKGVVMHENGIENLETNGVILEFENPMNQVSGTETLNIKTTWEDKTEKEESSTNEISIDPTNILPYGAKIYFKYPVS